MNCFNNKMTVIGTYLLLQTGTVYAEYSFWDHVTIRRHSSDLSQKEKPAEIYFQNYKEVDGQKPEKSYQINAAISYNHKLSDNRSVFSFTLEQHKNTFNDSTTKPQDQRSFKMGYQTTSLEKERSPHENSDLKENYTYITPYFNIGYEEEEIVNTKSITLTGGLGYYNMDLWINEYQNLFKNNDYKLYWNPITQLEYKNILKSKNSSNEGDVLRLKSGLEIETKLFKPKTDGELTFSLSYIYWSDIKKDSSLGKKENYPLREATLAYSFNTGTDWKPQIALRYYNGENISESSPEQEYIGVILGIAL